MSKIKAPSFKTLFYFILTISLASRIVLAAVNKGYANDDHYSVSKLILETGKIPEPQDCWQCYQLKLYHFTVAKLWGLFGLETELARYQIAQVINGFAGVFTILICWLFIKKQRFRKSVKLVCFSLVALNPSLITINAQATNDSFMILFGTLVIYSLYKLIAKPTARGFMVLLICSILAGLTKVSSVIIFIGVILVLVIKIINDKNYKLSLNKGYLGSLIIFLIVIIPTIGYFGEYYGNYKKYDRPVVFNSPVGEIPHWSEKTDFMRPGVQSIVGGYFTFRIIDMINDPIITNSFTIYSLHRTSVWSQLYGRTHFLYFENCPAGLWQRRGPAMRGVGRVALTLALFPTLVFLIGIFIDFKVWFVALFRRRADFLRKNYDWIFHFFFIGFLLFIILFTLKGRDYSFMKIIYLFPGILAAVIPLLKGFDYVYKYVVKNRRLFVTFYTVIVALLIAYLIPIINLITQLT